MPTNFKEAMPVIACAIREDKGGRVLNTHSKYLTALCVSDVTSVYTLRHSNLLVLYEQRQTRN